MPLILSKEVYKCAKTSKNRAFPKISDKKSSTSDVKSSTSDVIFGKNFASGLSFQLKRRWNLEEFFNLIYNEMFHIFYLIKLS